MVDRTVTTGTRRICVPTEKIVEFLTVTTGVFCEKFVFAESNWNVCIERSRCKERDGEIDLLINLYQSRIGFEVKKLINEIKIVISSKAEEKKIVETNYKYSTEEEINNLLIIPTSLKMVDIVSYLGDNDGLYIDLDISYAIEYAHIHCQMEDVD